MHVKLSNIGVAMEYYSTVFLHTFASCV